MRDARWLILRLLYIGASITHVTTVIGIGVCAFVSALVDLLRIGPIRPLADHSV